MTRQFFAALTLASAAFAAETSADRMQLFRPGVPVRFELDREESSFHQISLPAGEIKVAVDMHRSDGRSQDVIQAAMSVVDSDGVPIGSLGFNFVDVDSARREVRYYRLKRPMTLGFKITNHSPLSNFWLTVTSASASFIPLEGERLPHRIALGETGQGELDPHQSEYFQVSLPRGNYRVIMDLETVSHRPEVLIGYSALLTADGGEPNKLFSYSDYDSSQRKAGAFRLKEEATVVIRVHTGTVSPVNYSVKVVPSQD